MTRPNGRPAKPTELKLLEGNPGRRPSGNKVRGDIPSSIPDPPAQLGVAGLAAWALYWEHARAWLAITDVPILTQLCEAHDEVELMAATIRSQGLTRVNRKTRRSAVHPLYNDLRGLRREIRELWSLCYMTPTDRGRANVRVKDVDPLEEWAST